MIHVLSLRREHRRLSSERAARARAGSWRRTRRPQTPGRVRGRLPCRASQIRRPCRGDLARANRGELRRRCREVQEGPVLVRLPDVLSAGSDCAAHSGAVRTIRPALRGAARMRGSGDATNPRRGLYFVDPVRRWAALCLGTTNGPMCSRDPGALHGARIPSAAVFMASPTMEYRTWCAPIRVRGTRVSTQGGPRSVRLRCLGMAGTVSAPSRISGRTASNAAAADVRPNSPVTAATRAGRAAASTPVRVRVSRRRTRVSARTRARRLELCGVAWMAAVVCHCLGTATHATSASG